MSGCAGFWHIEPEPGPVAACFVRLSDRSGDGELDGFAAHVDCVIPALDGE